MFPIQARAVFIKQEAAADSRSMARIERMLPFIEHEGDPVVIDDAGLRDLLTGPLKHLFRHGRRAEEIEPIVMFNQFLYTHSPAEQKRRREAYPELFRRGGLAGYGGYGGWDWRASGDAAYRRQSGLICQPAYALHSFWGCHFRCAYCNLGHMANIYVNLEDWIEHIERNLSTKPNSPRQRLFQWDNGTDVVCWEPEYGGTKMLVELFARQQDAYLELYVGKSDHVDFMLEYEHRGHTTCCWSLAPVEQADKLEKRTAGMEARLAAAKACQEAGYPVRIRFSPMIPFQGWEDGIRHMIQRMFEEIRPEMLTIEPLRFYTYEQLLEDFEPGVIDAEFLEAMKAIPATADAWTRSQFPEELRCRMYRVVFDEASRISPQTPIAFCREKRTVWETFRPELERLGQDPDNYVCNCGPYSAGDDPRVRRCTA